MSAIGIDVAFEKRGGQVLVSMLVGASPPPSFAYRAVSCRALPCLPWPWPSINENPKPGSSSPLAVSIVGLCVGVCATVFAAKLTQPTTAASPEGVVSIK